MLARARETARTPELRTADELLEKMMADHVSSTSDDRTVNNAVRHKYRVLTEEEKAAMARIKDKGAELIGEIAALDPVMAMSSKGPEEHHCLCDRNLELARCHVEDAVMRAVRHVTS
jgi:hypothetical protein